MLLFLHLFVSAQNVVVSDVAGYTSDSSAILDVNSSSRGLLPPSMSTAERDSILNPAEGLIIFNTSGKTLEVFNGSSWSSATSKFICGSSQIADTSGNIYNTIKIGGQCWMAENLNIGVMVNGSVAQSDNSVLEKYCYNNTEDSCSRYGGLYQWNELMHYSSVNTQGICPDGWHVPTDAEWCILEKEVDLTIDCDAVSWRGVDAGNKLKQGGKSGFAAIYSGIRNASGLFENVAADACFWTSAADGADAWSRHLKNSEKGSARNEFGMNYGLSVRCLKNIKTLPGVTTGTATNITDESAGVTGEIDDIGWATITEYGHCWSMTPGPTIDDDLFNVGTTDTTGTFISNLHDLVSNTTYYVRAYAINSKGVAYGEEIMITTLMGNGAPCQGLATITYDGQIYNTVKIGNQCWLRENLNIGTMIDGSIAQSNNGTIEKYCYSNVSNNCDTYGGLYLWDEMMQYVTTEGARGICPEGWHIPTDVEWCLLQQYLDEAPTECNPPANYPVGIDAAGKTKMVGSTHWTSPNKGAINSSGFTAMPGGNVSSNSYIYIHTYGYFWTSHEFNATNAIGRSMASFNAYISRFTVVKSKGYSVRCIKD